MGVFFVPGHRAVAHLAPFSATVAFEEAVGRWGWPCGPRHAYQLSTSVVQQFLLEGMLIFL